MFLRDMSTNKTPEKLEELLTKIKDAKGKLVVFTYGERVNSPFLSRRQYKMRVYHTDNVRYVLEKAQRVFEKSSFPSIENIAHYAKSFCEACKVMEKTDVPFPRLCKRHRSIIEIPVTLWNSNRPYVFAFYVLPNDAIFMFKNHNWLLILNKDVAFVKRPDGTIFRYRKRIKWINENQWQMEKSSYNYLVNKVLSIISQLEYMLLSEITLVDP